MAIKRRKRNKRTLHRPGSEIVLPREFIRWQTRLPYEWTIEPERDLIFNFPRREQIEDRLGERIFRVRSLEAEILYQDQVSRGRPPNTWKSCPGGSNVFLVGDRTDTVMLNGYIVVEHKKFNVYRTQHNVIGMLAATVWPHLETLSDKIKARLVMESFFLSPVVLHAVWHFIKFSKGKVRHSHHLRDAILRILPYVRMIITHKDAPARQDLLHYYIYSPFILPDSEWGLEDHLVRFFLTLETWRWYPGRRNRAWEFGDLHAALDVMAGILVVYYQFYELKWVKERAFRHGMVDQLWDRWLRVYQTSPGWQGTKTKFMPVPCIETTGRLTELAERGRQEGLILQELGYLSGTGHNNSIPWRHRRRKPPPTPKDGNVRAIRGRAPGLQVEIVRELDRLYDLRTGGQKDDGKSAKQQPGDLEREKAERSAKKRAKKAPKKPTRPSPFKKGWVSGTRAFLDRYGRKPRGPQDQAKADTPATT